MKYFRQDIYLIVLVLLICFFHFQYFHGGYLGTDELEYIRLAAFFNDGLFSHDSLYAFRYMGFIPLSLINLLFGKGDFANTVVPVLTLTAIMWMVLTLMKNMSLMTKSLAVLILLFNPVHLLFLEKPMPDFTVELGFILCFYSYYRQRFEENIRANKTNILLFLIGTIVIFLSKETFLIFYPFFLWLFVTDIFNKTRRYFWGKIIIGLVIFILIYLVCNFWFLGNPFARIEAIFSNRYISECTYELQHVSVVLKRILYKLWLDMMRNGFLWPLGFAIVMLMRKNRLEKKDFFLVKSWIVLLLLSNFMTISYSDYVPLCNDPRHFLFVLPIGAILWAKGWEKCSEFSLKEIFVCLFLFAVQLFISVYYNYENTWFLFVALMAGLVAFQWTKLKVFGFILVMLGMGSVFIQNANYNKKINHKGQKELIYKVLKANDQPKYILTDRANVNIGSFYAEYDNKNTFVVFNEYDENIHIGRETYIIMNGMTAYLSNTDWEKVPGFVKTAQDSLPQFFQNKSGVMYKVEGK
jgi:hypothetical protein